MQEGNAPLTARSVLASALLGMDPPELPVAQLVRLAGLFDFSANRARVALSRMVAAGEASTDGSGRYRLAGHLVQRQSRQSASRSGDTGAYSGQWHLVVVTTAGSSAEIRLARRQALAYARLAELREGVWMRPANLEVVVPSGQVADLEVMSAQPADPHRRAGQLLHSMQSLPPVGPDALAPGFELSAAVLRHLQADPLLPADLLPADWPGGRLRSVYDGWDAAYRLTLQEWSRTE